MSQARWRSTPLRCPHCNAALGSTLDGEHACFEHPLLSRGGRVLDLAREEHYWNHLDRGQMSALLETARQQNWRAALDEHLRPRVDDYVVAYAVDERRADWYPLCDVPHDGLVLDVGAGWGAVSTALARQGAEVLALDSNLETLEFIGIRCEQEGFGERVHPVRTDPLERTPLPVADASVDLVILNGVLEWVGAGIESGAPRDHQLRVLRDARRVLRTRGCLYLAIESRYGLAMLLGGEDHPGTRFTSVVPRRLASWMTRRAGKGEYRTFTYDQRALDRLLEEAGFGTREFHCAYPDYRFPHSMVPLADATLFRRSIARPGLSKNHARALAASARLGLHRDLVNHFAVVAKS